MLNRFKTFTLVTLTLFLYSCKEKEDINETPFKQTNDEIVIVEEINKTSSEILGEYILKNGIGNQITGYSIFNTVGDDILRINYFPNNTKYKFQFVENLIIEQHIHQLSFYYLEYSFNNYLDVEQTIFDLNENNIGCGCYSYFKRKDNPFYLYKEDIFDVNPLNNKEAIDLLYLGFNGLEKMIDDINDYFYKNNLDLSFENFELVKK